MTEARNLTPGEVALAQSVYGNNLKTNEVKIDPERFFGVQPPDQFMTPFGNVYTGTRNISDSSTVSVQLQAVFIHELDHSLQYQSGVNVFLAGLALEVTHGSYVNSQVTEQETLSSVTHTAF